VIINFGSRTLIFIEVVGIHIIVQEYMILKIFVNYSRYKIHILIKNIFFFEHLFLCHYKVNQYIKSYCMNI